MSQAEKWTVAVWGTRGAIPTPGPAFMEYGGNTSCVSVSCGKELAVFDAGSGIAGLGNLLSRQKSPKKLHLFISHLHLDHIIGLTSFRPLHDPSFEVCLYGEGRDGACFRETLGRVLNPPFWPVGIGDFRAKLTVREIGPGQRVSLAEGLTVDTLRSNHPNQSLIFRLEGMGRRVVYTLDCELNDSMEAPLTDFAQNCDLLIWDANFTQGNLIPGWGHSTWEQGAALGEKANAAMVLMSHYDRTYTDSFLREQERLAKQKSERCVFAREGAVIGL